MGRKVRSRRRQRGRNNNRARRNRPGAANLRALATTGPANQRTNFRPKFGRGIQIPRVHGLSDNGLAFLKCAFAAPDFSVDPGKGIPDNFHGRTLSIKDCFTTAKVFTPNTDTYIIQAPVPGYAYFEAEVPIGTAPIKFVGVPFPTYATNFGTSGTDTENLFSKFRYASLASGIYPTSNMMQFAGSIQVWRVDLNLAETLATHTAAGSTDAAAVGKRIQGLQGITTLVPRDNYSDSFIKGAYTFGFDKSDGFAWSDFVSSVTYPEAGNAVPILPATREIRYDGTHRLTGLGNTNTIVYKVSTPTGAINAAMMRFWNCIELQPDTNSALFQFSGVSPPHDPAALEIYHNLKMQFPVALPCADNAKFWETVLRAIEHVSRIGKLLPGPIGIMSGGVNTAATALQGMYGFVT